MSDRGTSYPTELLLLLQEREHFLVTSHARPDGDAIGSALGLMHLLEGMGKRVDVAFADPVPSVYQSLPGADRIRAPRQTTFACPSFSALTEPLPPTVPDAAIVLECDSIQRTGFAAIPAGFLINIDHHKSGQPFGDWNWIDPGACAVGAMIYEFAIAAGLPIFPEAATCLYTAVLTDTGSFTFPCTTAATFALAGHLMECGANAHDIAQAVYFSNPESKVRILGAVLNRIIVEGALAWSEITMRDIRDANASISDCEGAVNSLIGIAGIQAAVVFRELPDGAGWRASLRSKGALDVALVAEHFGGGGHHNASGCTLAGDSSPILADLRSALRADLPVASPVAG